MTFTNLAVLNDLINVVEASFMRAYAYGSKLFQLKISNYVGISTGH